MAIDWRYHVTWFKKRKFNETILFYSTPELPLRRRLLGLDLFLDTQNDERFFIKNKGNREIFSKKHNQRDYTNTRHLKILSGSGRNVILQYLQWEKKVSSIWNRVHKGQWRETGMSGQWFQRDPLNPWHFLIMASTNTISNDLTKNKCFHYHNARKYPKLN
jgi:hypothetical protein